MKSIANELLMLVIGLVVIPVLGVLIAWDWMTGKFNKEESHA